MSLDAFNVISPVAISFFNKAHRFVHSEGEVDNEQFLEHLDLFFRFYIASWETWLELIGFVTPLDSKDLRNSFSEFAKSCETFESEPTSERYKEMLSTFSLFSTQWLSFEGSLRKYIKESLNLPTNVNVPIKMWELILLYEAKKSVKYQTSKKFDVKSFLSLLQHLIFLRRTSQVYMDLSLAQFFIYPNELRGFYSSYFLLLNDKEDLHKRIHAEMGGNGLGLTLIYPQLEEYETLYRYWAWENTPLEEDVQELEERASRFLEELKEYEIKTLISNWVAFETNLRNDPMNFIIAYLPYCSDVLLKYRFLLDTVEIPSEEAQLLQDRLRFHIDLAVNHYKSMFLPDENLKSKASKLVELLERVKSKIGVYSQASDMDEDFSELSKALLEFNTSFEEYTTKFKGHDYLGYLFEVLYRVSTGQAPIALLEEELEQVNSLFPDELQQELEEGRPLIHPFVKLTDEERDKLKRLFELYFYLKTALDEYIYTSDITGLENVWKELYGMLDFVSSLSKKMEEAQKSFDELIKKELEKRGVSTEEPSYLLKQLVYYSISEDKSIIDMSLRMLEDIMNNLSGIPLDKLPEELSDIRYVKDKLEELLGLLDELYEEHKPEVLEEAISIAVSLNPVISNLRLMVMDMLTDLQRKMEEYVKSGAKRSKE